MPVDNPLFLIPSSSGVIFILLGLIMLKFPPKTINPIYGYKTGSSMKNQERWDFAQVYAAKILMIAGAFLILFSLLGFVFTPSHSTASALGMAALIGSVIGMLIKVEYALKQKFR
ncbi:SdpI family protein [Mangrovimonas sp. YM274]|uniref:SdpI family protein n=1 Tax=Mangrovimonas sp. YM274 TaxID=3070660 RepID=UPI0027DE0928|nr:SdpI family protein [Mangrovimonas sp. YM274]WMI68685.1 SdpI family protein [Mangrovimonas sp. YM274]